MKLIIAEKPMLARAITAAIDGRAEQKNGYIVKGNYTIVSAFGHLLTLKDPEDYDQKLARWELSALPIYFDNWGKKPGPGKEERLNLIGELLKNAECVIHAGDPDDEGQYLIDEILDWFDYKGEVFRLSTGDTTEGALRKALENMKSNSEFRNSGWSSHARSVADIMTGYNFSRYFTLKNPHIKMLTVGRVQTPTLGLVVNRDMAIEGHTKQFYYAVKADLDIDGKSVTATYEPGKGDPSLDDGKITNRAYAEQIAEALNDKNLENIKITEKELTEQPPLPFNLVKLQTYASNKFGYDPSQTLEITQSLRDRHNAITYNRSDCQYLSEEQFKEAPATVAQVMKNLSADPAGAVFAKMPIDTTIHSKAFDDKNITAHTAIIPQKRALELGKLTEEERNIYLAINKYYMAQFLPAAKKKRTMLEVQLDKELITGEVSALEAEADSDSADKAFQTNTERENVENRGCGTLKATSTKITFPGYMQLIKPEKKSGAEYNPNERGKTDAGVDSQGEQCRTDSVEDSQGELSQTIPDEENQSELSKLTPGEYRGHVAGSHVEEKETKAPPRYTKASLNEDMTRIAKYVTDPRAKALLLSKDKDKKGENGSIGTSATRSGIIDTLEERGYIECKGKQIQSTQLGRELYRILPEELKKPDMTGLWWAVQEEIKDGEAPWTALTDSVLEMINKVIKTDYPKVDAYNIPESMRRGRLILGRCPRCGGDVVEGKNGFGCMGFRNGCKFVVWKTAKSGMMSKTEVTADMVHTLLASEWVQEERMALRDEAKQADGNSQSANTNSSAEELKANDSHYTGRLRTTAAVLVKKLYSERTKNTYSGRIYLADEGKGSPYSAGFGIESIEHEPPVSLGKCPRCGRDVVESKSGYGCTGFKDGCRFMIWKKQKQKMLSKIEFTKTDAKRFLAGKPSKKNHLLDRKGNEFKADLIMEETPDNPYGPVFRVLSGTIETKDGDASAIKVETVDL